jgi:transposase
MRDRTRARAEAISDCTDAQVRLQAFGLRHAIRSTGRAHWGPAHLRGLSAVVWPTPTQPIVFQEDGRAVQEPTARLQRLGQERHAHGHAWRLSPVVEALQAWRGVQGTGAVTLLAAMGDLPRFDTPRALRQCLGLPPSAYSSGAPRRQGAIPKAGNTHARRVLVEGAWASRSPAKVRRQWQRRRATHPTIIQDIRGKAHVRRCNRYRCLVARGKHATIVTGAMARAVAGCMWAIAREVPIIPSGR